MAGGSLPHRLLGFLGDDFTGSSAVMEVMSFAGLPTVMFLAPPDKERLAAFGDYRGIGIASTARATPPAAMDADLPGPYSALAALDAPINHYKVCSTFDSSPEIGSIGRAIELALPIFAPRFVPLVVGAPAIGRYQAFGNLFAAFGGDVFRLDRHPVMARHPSTPMDEADLARHLARQTDLPVGLVDIAALKSGGGRKALDKALAAGARIVSIDVLDEETLAAAGELLWQEAAGHTVFTAGSQGVEYALIAHWRAAGLIGPAEPPPPLSPAERIIAVSGSVSPTTAAQIAHAEAHGFAVLQLDVAALVDEARWDLALDAAQAEARRALAAGTSPLIVTARGPDDPSVARLSEALATSGLPRDEASLRLGSGLGRILRTLVAEMGVTRAVISGGDTSGHATTALGVDAISALTPLAPGAPLCRTHCEDPAVDGLELALKGGQMGAADYFVRSLIGNTAGVATRAQWTNP